MRRGCGRRHRLRSSLTGITLSLGMVALSACGGAEPAKPSGSETPEDVKQLLHSSDSDAGQAVAVDLGTASKAPGGSDQGVSGQTRYMEALNYHRNGDEKAALRELEKCLKEYPSYTDAWYLKGKSHMALGENDKAIESFKKLIEVDPKYADAYFGIGQSYLKMKDYGNAVDAFHTLVTMDPSADHQRALGAALALKGDYPLAQKAFEDAIKGNPKDESSVRQLADTLLAQGKRKEAQERYQSAMALDPKDDRAVFNYGVCLQGDGKSDEAIAAYKKAIDANPKNADAFLNLGVVYAQKSDNSAAVEAFESYLKLNPNAPDAAKIRDQIALLRS